MQHPQSGLGLHISPLDLAIIVVYLVGITTAGLWSVRKLKMTGNAYFLAGRSLRWPVVGAALFAANISSIHLVGLAASGYKEGFVWGNFEWMAVFTLILLSLVFAPFYFRTRIATLPEYLERRYNAAARTILAVMAILAALLIHIGMSMYAGAAVFKEFFGLDVTTSIVIIALVTGLYTVLGGLRAVMITETIQSVLLIGSAVTVTDLRHPGPARRRRSLPGRVQGRPQAGPNEHAAAGRPQRRPGMAAVRARFSGAGDLVLVHRSDHRAAGSRCRLGKRRPERGLVRRAAESPAGVHLGLPGRVRLRAVQRAKSAPTPTRPCRC